MSKAEGKKITIKFTEDLVGDVSGLTPTPVGYKAGATDLAQGKEVLVGNQSYGAGTRAVDGSDSTYWGTYSTLPWWIMVDLVEIKKTAGFYILQNNSSYRARTYEVQGSNDSDIWSTIQTGELENISDQIIEYPVSEYRYIRLNFTSYWSSSRAYIYTLKILEAEAMGNEGAFNLPGKEYKYVRGPLLDKEYKPISVERHPTVDKAILLTFPIRGEFNNAEGPLTVEYDETKGNLSGQGGAVESFTEVFTPTGLKQTPNPGIEETITVSPTQIIADFLKVEYIEGYGIEAETITAAPVTVTVELLHTSIVNP